jgi:anti-anti-sigma factor
MNNAIDSESHIRVIRISGDVDILRAPELAELENELSAESNVILDVGDLKYADTTFLRFLLRLRAQSNKSGRDSIRLVRATRRLQRLLEVTGLDRMFAVSTRCPA